MGNQWGNDRERAGGVLRDALEFLATAREGLSAFGAPHDAEAQACRDEEEIARRLIQSLGA